LSAERTFEFLLVHLSKCFVLIKVKHKLVSRMERAQTMQPFHLAIF